MGPICKRGDVWWIRYHRDGRRYEESARTDKWEEAGDLLRTREGDVAKGVPVSSKIGRIRFEDAAKDLIADYTVNKKRTLGLRRARGGPSDAVVPRAAAGVDYDLGRQRVRGAAQAAGRRTRPSIWNSPI